MVLQSFEGLSDRDAVDRLGRDLAWQAAAGVDIGREAFHSRRWSVSAIVCALVIVRSGSWTTPEFWTIVSPDSMTWGDSGTAANTVPAVRKASWMRAS